MSFSKDTKNELSRINPEKKCCMLAEIAGFIRTSGTIRLAGAGRFNLVLTTENPAVARHIKKLIKEYFNVDTTIRIGQGNTLKKRKYYMMDIGHEDLSEQIMRETGILMVKEGMNYITDGVYSDIIKTKCCKKAYLRGAFLGAGTMTNPEKGYQFEIVCNTEALANDIKKLINSFVDIHAKKIVRKKEHIVYVKRSSEILDILAIMGAHSQYLIYDDVRFQKRLRGEANRLSNCDQANIDKAIMAGEKQIANIKKIGLENLSIKLREVAEKRLENPEATLSQIGEMLDPPLKKSGVNNRLKKIEELANKWL